MAHSVRGFAYETWWFYTVLLVYQKVCRLSQKLWKRCQNCYLKWGNSLRMVKFWDIAHFETNSCPKSCGWNHGIWRSRLGFSMFFDTAHHIKGRAFACVSLAEAWHRPYVLYVSKILPSLLPEMGMDQNLFIGGMNIYIYSPPILVFIRATRVLTPYLKLECSIHRFVFGNHRTVLLKWHQGYNETPWWLMAMMVVMHVFILAGSVGLIWSKALCSPGFAWGFVWK